MVKHDNINNSSFKKNLKLLLFLFLYAPVAQAQFFYTHYKTEETIEYDCDGLYIFYWSEYMPHECPNASVVAYKENGFIINRYLFQDLTLAYNTSGTGDGWIFSDFLEDSVHTVTYITYFYDRFNPLNGDCYTHYRDTFQIDTITIERKCFWQYIPNVFTPNSDGINDYFDTDIKIYHEVLIYNRWGQLVFQSNYPDVKWDGGNYPAGTYYYLIEIPLFERTISKKGTVTLIR